MTSDWSWSSPILFLALRCTFPLWKGAHKWARLTHSNIASSGWPSGKESTWQCRRHRTRRFDPWVRKIPWSRKWQPTPVLLPEESHGQSSLEAIVHGIAESDVTDHMHTIYWGCFWLAQKPFLVLSATGITWASFCNFLNTNILIISVILQGKANSFTPTTLHCLQVYN